jgi:predicted KAP-like P-loop ATPase
MLFGSCEFVQVNETLARETMETANMSSEKHSEKEYSSDQPIFSIDHDSFNRWPFAQRIADTIARRNDPGSLVIAIYGIWGDGKTSVLNLMEKALSSFENVILVRFNPWYFQSEDQLIKGFFATLADALKTSIKTKSEQLGEILEKYGSILSMASISFFGGAAAITPGAGMQELGKQLSTAELDELKTRMELILNEANKKVVVLIDDIDRLDRTEIQAIFKLVKLSADFKETAYVLAFDDEIVSDALGEKYGSGSREAGRNFLEKIIQVPLNLPPPDELSLRKMTFQGVDAALKLSGIELTEEQAQAFGRHFIDGMDVRLKTPRQAKRYGNVLTFALPILKAEVHPVDHMLIEAMRVFYPKLYLVVRANADVCLGRASRQSMDAGAKERLLERLQPGFEGLESSEKDSARGLIQALFPRLEGVFGNMNYESNWDERWEKEKRVCSDQYFHRYFSYAIPPGDLSDLVLDSFLDLVSTAEESVLLKSIRQFIERGQGATFIHKLRRREHSLTGIVAERLAIALAKIGNLLPREKGQWSSILSTFAQGAFLIYKLVCQIPGSLNRERVAVEVIKQANPLPFAFECLRWLRKNKESTNPAAVRSEIEQKLCKNLAGRIRAAALDEPLYIAFPDTGSPALFWAWNEYGSKGDVKKYLTKRFESYPNEVPKFLASYVGVGWGLDGLSHKSDLTRDSYDAIVKVIDPKTIVRHLRSIYGANIEDANYCSSGELSDEQRIAEQFVAIYRGVVSSKK